MERADGVERAARGDAEAFRELVVSHRRLVYAICLAESVDPAEAEDLTQEVFLLVHRDLPGLREPEKFLAWLRQVTRNACRLWFRRHGRREESLDAALDIEDAAAGDAARRAEVRRIAVETLAAISVKSREVLALRYLAGCSEAEIAEALGVPVTTIKSRLHEGRGQARRALEPLVKELLRFDTRSDEAVERIVERCGHPGCGCPETLTEGR